MTHARRLLTTRLATALASLGLIAQVGTAITASAQSYKDLQTPRSPLVLKAWGSFFVGGDTVEATAAEMGIDALGLGGTGHLVNNQMYVQYLVPQGRNKIPVVMVHGGTLSGKGYETQPDGRMGWAEYFVRKGHPVYLPDMVTRGRSGFNIAPYNNVRAGVSPPSSQPPMFRFSDEDAWTLFRLGPKFGVPFRDAQFPVKAVKEFSKQSVPIINTFEPGTGGATGPDPNWKALSQLALDLKEAVIIGHSESGLFPLEATLINPKGTKGSVVMEPGTCKSNVYTDLEIAKLAKVPILVLYGDHLDTPSRIFDSMPAFRDCQAFVARVNAARGNATFLHLPKIGVFGNSHMLMNDKNSDQIGDIIMKWIDRNVDRRGPWHRGDEGDDFAQR